MQNKVSLIVAALFLAVMFVSLTLAVSTSQFTSFSAEIKKAQKTALVYDDASIVDYIRAKSEILPGSQKANLPALTDDQIVAIARNTPEGKSLVAGFTPDQQVAVGAVIGGVSGGSSGSHGSTIDSGSTAFLLKSGNRCTRQSIVPGGSCSGPASICVNTAGGGCTFVCSAIGPGVWDVASGSPCADRTPCNARGTACG